MKKIVRLTESDLVRLVKRVMNEQLMDYAKPKIQNPQLTGVKVRLYMDEANTREEKVVNIINIEKFGMSIKLTDERNFNYLFNCANNYISGKSSMIDTSNFYNKKYIADLKKTYCTTSAGGTPVINIGTYSQTNQNQPTNYV
jgi:hypothetical protein